MPLPFITKGETMDFVRTISNPKKNKLTEKEKEAADKLRLKEREKNSQMVTGIFKNLECSGGDAFVTYHQYKEDPTDVYHLWDGKEYTLPLGVAKQINNVCKYKRSKYLIDKDGNNMLTSDKPIERYQFVSTKFM